MCCLQVQNWKRKAWTRGLFTRFRKKRTTCKQKQETKYIRDVTKEITSYQTTRQTNIDSLTRTCVACTDTKALNQEAHKLHIYTHYLRTHIMHRSHTCASTRHTLTSTHWRTISHTLSKTQSLTPSGVWTKKKEEKQISLLWKVKKGNLDEGID